MLSRTFCHLPRVGLKTERMLWSRGISDWEDFLQRSQEVLSDGQRRRLLPLVRSSREELRRGNAGFFSETLPGSETWRLFDRFRHTAAYVDIETTGTGGGLDHITTIALYDGSRVKTYVHGRNLERFADDILGYSLLVTFNGTCFDVPFLRREMAIERPAAHIDLRFVLRALGFSGGLKACEIKMGLDRGLLCGVDGYDAVLLWRAFEATGDERFLNTLLAYNVEDVINLETLMVRAYNAKLRASPFAGQPPLAEPSAMDNPYAADPEALRRIGRGPAG
jgi:hypothetical protein